MEEPIRLFSEVLFGLSYLAFNSILCACMCVCLSSDLKRLLPSMSPDPTELQRAIEVQLLRSAVSAMSKTIQQQEQRTTTNPE